MDDVGALAFPRCPQPMMANVTGSEVSLSSKAIAKEDVGVTR